ncbi:MAG: hypothetical protein GX575_07765 [Candidatus Anammoximicrobium sp.]|nr:hypothetical protein [Candidatus Anammoximicrobium sp.]
MFVVHRRSLQNALFLGLAVVVATSGGCVGLTAQLLYWFHGGNKIDPEFKGLKDKRIAVVCVSNTSSFGPDSFCSLLERRVAAALREQGDKIDLVPPDEVADWIDSNDWNQMDYREIGRGVNADMVVGLDLGGLRLHEGQTLYQGRVTLTVTVYDMEDGGKVAFRRTIPDFTFPQNGPRHATEMSEARFRSLFIEVLSKHVAKYFCAYDFEEDFARDAMGVGG